MAVGYANKWYVVFPADWDGSKGFEFIEAGTDHFSTTNEINGDPSFMDYRVDNMEANNDWTFFNSVMWI